MKTELLNPASSEVILIAFQPQMFFGLADIDRQTLFSNVPLRANAAGIFKVPTILTTVEGKGFSGTMWPLLPDIFPDQRPVERSSVSSREGEKFVAAVVAAGRKKLVTAHLRAGVALDSVVPDLQHGE